MNAFASVFPQSHDGIQSNNHFFGGGNMDPGAAMYLKRALQAGTQSPAFGGGGPYQLQSLDRVLRNLTFTDRSFVAWRRCQKQEATATFHSYDLVTDYGGEGGGFVNPGEAPAVQNSNLGRTGVYIKYLATQREVADPLTMVKPAHEDPLTLQTKHAAMWLLEQMERSMFFGNSSIVPQEWDGWLAQLFADPNFVNNNVKDMRGQHITEDDVEEAARLVIENHGVANELFMTPNALSALTKQYYSRQRFAAPSGGGNVIGFQATGQITSAGTVEFCPDIHIRPGRRKGKLGPPITGTYPLAPPPPAAVVGSVPAPIAGNPSLFDAASAGIYSYFVTAVNRFGESAPTQITADLTFAAGDSSTITVTPGSTTTTGYVLYRTKKGSSLVADAQIVRRLALNEPYIEQNYLLPGHGHAFMMQNDTMNKYIALLCPMAKVQLSRNALSQRWAQVIYAHPVLCAPQKNYVFINVPDSNTILA